MDYRELFLLWAARETGVLDAVTTNAGTPAEIAETAAVTERAAAITVGVLADRGFLKDVEGEYEITNRALGFIAKADIRSIGSFPHRLDCIDRAFDLPETMRTGEPPARSEDWTRNRMGATATVDEATVRACVTAAVHEHSDADTVLNVGGGPGTFATEFARRGYDVTLFDQPDVIDIDRTFLEHEPVNLASGDLPDALPDDGFDIVFCSRVAHTLGPDANQQLLQNVRDAVEPGGVAVYVDYVRGRSDMAPTIAAHMLAQTDRGRAYAADEFVNWFDTAGFSTPTITDIPGTELQSIAGEARD